MTQQTISTIDALVNQTQAQLEAYLEMQKLAHEGWVQDQTVLDAAAKVDKANESLTSAAEAVTSANEAVSKVKTNEAIS